MKRSPKAERDHVFKHVMSLYGLATGFDAGQVFIDFYSYGGGYVIEMKCHNSGGTRHPFGNTRRNSKEFMAFLEGLRAAKVFEEQRRIDINAMRIPA